ncbi:MAG TPA: leucine--tRNA ligase, partial [Candidatus Nanoarchaeia archaeon]|nr:leucine--tRNA ligase [Candidatus Nanoarchaeia archaeon]
MAYAYDPTQVEPKWQKKWEEEKVYEIDIRKAKDPFYLLVMFPYPSGAQLHIGHWFQYSIPDSYGRFLRMRGKDVLHPMGFDAFGLPAENYAIKTGVPPVKSIKENTDAMVDQFKRMGVMFDWKYLLNTSTPEYYKWTQWLFQQMFKNKLAYKKLGNVNYCPKDQTVLANEQVWDGKCERCGTEVIQKPLEQWYWQITKYAQRLLDGHKDLDWPEKTKLMQQNWINRSEGAEVRFEIAGTKEAVTVFTTRPDTIFGATYLVLAPEHPLVDSITTEAQKKKVEAYRKEISKKTELQRTDLAKDKTGVETGTFAINPATNEKIPVWIADYVLLRYGTGAIMAVPGHDERDFEFAKEFKLSVKEVVKGGDPSEGPFTGEGVAVHSDFLDGKSTTEAKRAAIEWLEKKEIGKGVIQYRLRDWL